MAASAAIIGSTGLVGSLILADIITHDSYKPVHTMTRRAPKTTSPHLTSIVDADTTKWAPWLSTLCPAPSTVFSALGTTRADAGSLDEQWKIDHDLNIALARAAKDAGVKTFVFISSAGTRSLPVRTLSAYAKMKNGVEDAIQELGFEHAVVLKPGLIMGERERSRAGQGPLLSAVRALGRVSAGLRDAVGQEAEVIARAAVGAARLAEGGQAPSRYWVVEASEIVKLGRRPEAGAGAAAGAAAAEETTQDKGS